MEQFIGFYRDKLGAIKPLRRVPYHYIYHETPKHTRPLDPSSNPTIYWLLRVAKAIAEVIQNTPETEARKGLEYDPIAKIAELEGRLNAVIDAYRKKMGPVETIGEGMVNLTEPKESEEVFEELAKEIEDFCGKMHFKKWHDMELAHRASRNCPIYPPDNRKMDEYVTLFRTIQLPKVGEKLETKDAFARYRFDTDETFARYRLAGPNPMTLQCITKAELVKMIGDRIPDKDFNEIMKTKRDTLEKAGREGRLCVCNYKELTNIEPMSSAGPPSPLNPIAVFAEPTSGVDHILPIAIQMGQKPTRELVLANTKDYWRYRIAKTVVHVADCMIHALVSHIAFTHMIIQSFFDATVARMNKTHPLYKILMPHFEGADFINNGPREMPPLPQGTTAGVFGSDRQSGAQNLAGVAFRARFNLDIYTRCPDVDITARGVDKLKVYPYRDDVLLLWGAIIDWAKDYIDIYYEDDEAVINDEEIPNWCEYLQTNSYLKNFDTPESKEMLTRLLALLIFSASAQHSAMNFPNYQDIAFAPAMPAATWYGLPRFEERKGDMTERNWLRMLPHINIAVHQMDIAYVTGTVRHGRLGEYQSNVFPYFGTLDAKVGPALEKFRNQLEAIEHTINKRNEKRGAFAYEYLLPSKITASPNI